VLAGWHILQHTFKHQVVGGATDAVHSCRPSAAQGTSQHLQLLASAATTAGFYYCVFFELPGPLPKPPSVTIDHLSTVLLLPDGSVGSWGLLPAATPSWHVTVPFKHAPSGFGLYPLSATELADVWNTPFYYKITFANKDVTHSLPVSQLESQPRSFRWGQIIWFLMASSWG
jgi:hypothetical protein